MSDITKLQLVPTGNKSLPQSFHHFAVTILYSIPTYLDVWVLTSSETSLILKVCISKMGVGIETHSPLKPPWIFDDFQDPIWTLWYIINLSYSPSRKPTNIYVALSLWNMEDQRGNQSWKRWRSKMKLALTWYLFMSGQLASPVLQVKIIMYRTCKVHL